MVFKVVFKGQGEAVIEKEAAEVYNSVPPQQKGGRQEAGEGRVRGKTQRHSYNVACGCLSGATAGGADGG